jgi:hypothetical protein
MPCSGIPICIVLRCTHVKYVNGLSHAPLAGYSTLLKVRATGQWEHIPVM